jgi:DNA polymerase-3 subunit delta'
MPRAPAVAEIEDYPEADRLDGFLHPRQTARVYGHEDAERRFAGAFSQGRLHHAWLICGPEGIGKATFAYMIARFLLAPPCDRDLLGASLEIGADTGAARQVRALSHPDLFVIRRPYDLKLKKLRGEITVDEVRKLKIFLGLTAGEGEWRVVIVDTIDDMNANAANALLKSLEEPPTRTVFLLVSPSPGRLLPTIRSRCRTLALTPLAGETLKKAVQQALSASGDEIGASATPDPGEWERLERLSGGSVRRLLGLKASGGLELYERVLRLASGAPKLDWAAVHAVGDELASPAAEQKFELFFELLLGLLARLIEAAAGRAASAEDHDLAGRLIGEGRLAMWGELWETIVRDKTLAQALNLDRKSLILETFSRLEALARAA